MKLLLDTHIYLWWLAEPGALSKESRIAVANPRHFVFVSAASIVEIAIKQQTGKLTVDDPPEAMLESCRFRELPLKIAHASAMRSLPPVHKDPFDRMLVAQALVERMTLVTRDPALKQYGIPTIAA